jgi:hypothetical protein
VIAAEPPEIQVVAERLAVLVLSWRETLRYDGVDRPRALVTTESKRNRLQGFTSLNADGGIDMLTEASTVEQ